MQAFTRLDGRAAPLTIANIDTDQIIPAKFLKTVERAGIGKGSSTYAGWLTAARTPILC